MQDDGGMFSDALRGRREIVPRRTSSPAPRKALGPAHAARDGARTSHAEDPIRYYSRFGLLVCGLLVFGLGGWASLAAISGAVIAQATAVVEGNSKKIQHLEGGIVSSILVREGQHVARGEALLQLDDTQARSRIRYLNAQITSIDDQLTLVSEELSDLSALFRKGLTQKSKLHAVKRRKIELEGRRNESRAELFAAEDLVRRAVIRAPISGFVHQLAVHTVGGVIKAGETAMAIVPSRHRLVFEARIAPETIDRISPGQPAVLRFPAFDQRTTPEVTGVVARISADLTRESAESPPFYAVQITLPAPELARLPGKTLKAGMPAEVFIQASERNVLSYLVKPLSDQIARTFRER